MNQEIIKKAGDIITLHSVYGGGADKLLVCALGMIDLNGAPTVSAITAAHSEGIQWITFSTGLSSNKVKRLAFSNKASVCFLSETYNVSLVGRLDALTEPDIKRKTWYEALAQHFSGPEDPEYCVLKFTAERYNLLIDWQEARGAL